MKYKIYLFAILGIVLTTIQVQPDAKVILLGTETPYPSIKHQGPATAII